MRAWNRTGRTVLKTSYFCKEMMDVLVEGALATPSANVEHFPLLMLPNRDKQSVGRLLCILTQLRPRLTSTSSAPLQLSIAIRGFRGFMLSRCGTLGAKTNASGCRQPAIVTISRDFRRTDASPSRGHEAPQMPKAQGPFEVVDPVDHDNHLEPTNRTAYFMRLL